MEPDTITATPITPIVDCRGLICPAPILKIVETLRRHKGNVSTLTVLATDPEFAEDVEAWCRASRADLVKLTHQNDGVIRAQIRLGGARSEKPASKATENLRQNMGVASTVPPAPHMVTPRSNEWSERLRGSHEAGAAALRLATSERPVIRGATMRTLRPVIAPIASSEPASQPKEQPTSQPIAQPAEDRSAIEDEPPSPRPISGPREVMEPLPRMVAPMGPLPHIEDSYPPSLPTNMHRLVRTITDHAALIPDTPRPYDGLAESPLPRENRATLLVLHNDLEALLAALTIANGAAAQGMRTEVYFAFWGIHLLRGERRRAREGAEKPSLIQRLLLWLIPRGVRQPLGKLHMAGLGTRVLLALMRKRNILALDQLVEAASKNGVRFRVCTTSMALMGMTEDDIVEMPNVDFAGVAAFAEGAARSAVSLVF